MNRFFLTWICIAMLALGSVPAAAEQTLDRIAAVVNDDVILMSELDDQVELIRQRLEKSGTRLPPDNVLREQVLDRMIDTELKLQMAERAGIRIPDDQLNQALQRIAERNGVTLDQLPEMLASEGIDYEMYRRELRNQMITSRLEMQQVQQNVNITQDDVERYIANNSGELDSDTRYKLRHILVSVPENPGQGELDEARNRIGEIHQKLREGADFAELAVAHSDGQRSLEGGDLGWMNANEVPSIFNPAVQNLEKGQASDPIRSSYGFHLIKLEDVERSDPVMVREARIRHILIKPTAIMDEAAVREKLASLRERILAGEEFGELADEHSDDHSSAADGGVIDWQPLERFTPRFREKVGNLEKGKISEPFQTRYGWHIVEVLDRRRSDHTDQVRRNQAIQALRQKEMQEERELWIRGLRDRAYIDIRL